MERQGEEARQWILTGRVQGVGFRYFAKRAADRLGVRGWVRNRADGSVEVRVAGSPQVLDLFREELRRGPAGARVAHIQEEMLPDPPPGRGFEIRF